MGCKICSGLPSVPVVRRGLPTIWEWGPFLDFEEVPANEVDAFLSAIDEDVE